MAYLAWHWYPLCQAMHGWCHCHQWHSPLLWVIHTCEPRIPRMADFSINKVQSDMKLPAGSLFAQIKWVGQMSEAVFHHPTAPTGILHKLSTRSPYKLLPIVLPTWRSGNFSYNFVPLSKSPVSYVYSKKQTVWQEACGIEPVYLTKPWLYYAMLASYIMIPTEPSA